MNERIKDLMTQAGYSGDFLVQHFIDCDKSEYIDIGVGGLKNETKTHPSIHEVR